ncbi:MAG: LamG-like jellyroll fold domain-containing protein [Pseudomonadota bacterium]
MKRIVNILFLIILIFILSCFEQENSDNSASDDADNETSVVLSLTGQISSDSLSSRFSGITDVSFTARSEITLPVGVPTPGIITRNDFKSIKSSSNIDIVALVLATNEENVPLIASLVSEDGSFELEIENEAIFRLYVIPAIDECTSLDISCFIDYDVVSLYKTTNNEYDFAFNASVAKSLSLGSLSFEDYDTVVSLDAIDITSEPEIESYVTFKDSAEKMIAYWTFNEQTGAAVYNRKGDVDGEILGGEWASLDDMEAYYFDGYDDYVDLGTVLPGSSEMTNKMTLVAKIYPITIDSEHRAANGTYSTILSKKIFREIKDESAEDKSSFWFGLEYNQNLKYSLILIVETENGRSEFISSLEVDPDKWSFVSAVYDAGLINFYVTNQEDPNPTCISFGSLENIQIDETVPLRIANSQNYVESTETIENNKYFYGYIDMVRIYSVAVMADNIVD